MKSLNEASEAKAVQWTYLVIEGNIVQYDKNDHVMRSLALNMKFRMQELSRAKYQHYNNIGVAIDGNAIIKLMPMVLFCRMDAKLAETISDEQIESHLADEIEVTNISRSSVPIECYADYLDDAGTGSSEHPEREYDDVCIECRETAEKALAEKSK